MDFSGVVAICESIASIRMPQAVRLWHTLSGSAEAGLPNYDRALDHDERLVRQQDAPLSRSHGTLASKGSGGPGSEGSRALSRRVAGDGGTHLSGIGLGSKCARRDCILGLDTLGGVYREGF